MTKSADWMGILLAAGKGARFDASGQQNKLMQALPSGDAVAVASAKKLLSVLPEVLAVVRPGAQGLAAVLQAAGCQVHTCADAEQGMAASLVYGLQQSGSCAGWIIALGDMPYVQAATLQAMLLALREGAGIVVPVHQGRRGNPVGFSHAYLPQLLALRGDQGARSLLARYPVTEVVVDDAGIHRDIDTRADLQ
ncbi:nucleotidyltransferase family protein [Undibacterium sp.]|jgi:molybdenum cofactor cytidylyltransferase|uniref:nucleotidyltransferase family protein n=1 Tax=Undibacterium sp. TaxID=1914977 RepID=UPI002B86C17D|nr:nucleotidyltransferase family protein [Undibacterium sp.]HTD06994.1 nucleotidyltransferase family protein [Undibacterium sp.]